MSKRILVADDDPHIREVIDYALRKAGMEVLLAATGTQALKVARAQKPDLIVLDIGMPEMDGLEVCKELRKQSDVPILFLSSRDEEVDRIIGLEIGGDDYVAKPFSPRELVARINSILKRANSGENQLRSAAREIRRGSLMLNKESREAYWQARRIELTSTEFDLLWVLASYPEKVYSRDALMSRTHDDVIVSERTIDSHIRHIRSKFETAGAEDLISTVHGVGYRLGSCER